MSEHELWNELGNLYFNSGAYREAVEAYQKAIQLDGEFGRPYSSLALTYVHQGEYGRAVDLYNKSIALSADPKEKAAIWNQLGNLYVQLKDYDEALLAYQIADELEEESNGNIETTAVIAPAAFEELIGETSDLVLSEVRVAADEPILQDEQWEPRDLGEPFPSDTATVSKITDDVEEYQQDLSAASETASAETWADANTDWNMELNTSLDQDAEIYFPSVDDDTFAGWLPIPEAESFDSVEVHSSLLDQLQDGSGIEEEYAMQDQGISSLEYMGAETPVHGRKYEYNEQFSLQVELDAGEEPASAIGSARRFSDQKSAAQIEYERSQSCDQTFESRDEEINEIKVEILKFKRVVQINPRNASAWDALGTHYKSAGMYKDAILAYQQAISADPMKGYYHHHLALVFAAEGRNEDAIMAYQKVIEIDPDHSLANAALGGYYRKMGLEELAQKHIGKAMKNIYNSESEYNQACLEAICGNSDQAIQLLRIALEEKQTYVNWVMHDPDLDAIREHPSFKQLISDFIK